MNYRPEKQLCRFLRVKLHFFVISYLIPIQFYTLTYKITGNDSVIASYRFESKHIAPNCGESFLAFMKLNAQSMTP